MTQPSRVPLTRVRVGSLAFIFQNTVPPNNGHTGPDLLSVLGVHIINHNSHL